MIPVKIDLFEQYDAAGAVRGLLFAGVTHVDGVVLHGGREGWRGGDCGTANGINGTWIGNVGREGEYKEGLKRLFGQVRMFLGGSRIVLLESGSGTHVSGVRNLVMTEVGDVASFVHA